MGRVRPACAAFSISVRKEYAVAIQRRLERRDTAELLTGSHCLVARADLPDDFEDYRALFGGVSRGVFGCRRTLGIIGTISDVQEMPARTTARRSGAGRGGARFLSSTISSSNSTIEERVLYDGFAVRPCRFRMRPMTIRPKRTTRSIYEDRDAFDISPHVRFRDGRIDHEARPGMRRA